MFALPQPDVRCLGGVSHVNKSLKESFHYQVVQLRSAGRYFYGVGDTVDYAKREALQKAVLAQKCSDAALHFVCGKASVPSEIYTDLLPSKSRSMIPTGHLCEKRLNAFTTESTRSEKPLIDFAISADPKVNAVLTFF